MVKRRIFTWNIPKTEKWIERFIEQGYRLVKVNANSGIFVIMYRCLKTADGNM